MPSQTTRDRAKKVLLTAGLSLSMLALISALVVVQAPTPGAAELGEDVVAQPALEPLPAAAPLDAAPPDVTLPGADVPALMAEHGAQQEPEAEQPSPVNEAPAATAAPQPTFAYQTQRLSASGLQLRFRSVDDLTALIDSADVDLILEYSDGRRYRIPKHLSGQSITAAVTEREFERLLSQGRISRLTPDKRLRQRVGIRDPGLKYLVVLSSSLRRQISASAAEAQRDPTRAVLLIEKGPQVSFL